MAREKHIVFQILNFLYSKDCRKYDLSPNEKLLLLNFADHKGPKGICPSLQTIADEMEISKRNVVRLLHLLEEKKLIFVNHTPGKSNHYTLNLHLISPPNTSELSTTNDTCITTEDVTSDTGVTTLVTSRVRTSDTGVTQSSKNHSYNHRERLSPVDNFRMEDFYPTDAQIKFAQSQRVNIDVELRSFRTKRNYQTYDAAIKGWDGWIQYHLVYLQDHPEAKLPKKMSGEEAWHDVLEKIEMGRMMFNDHQQKTLYRVAQWTDIRDASNEELCEMKNKFIEIYSSFQ